MPNPLARAYKAVQMRFSSRTTAWYSMFMGRTRYDYAREVGNGSNNSIVAACVLWICRTFPEAPVRVCTINSGGEDTPVDNHPLKLLLDTPNPYYPGELLWSATLADRTITGNAYWIKVRSAQQRVVELWWVPSTMMEPKWPDDGSQFISHYEYKPGTDVLRLETKDVVHFRYQTFDPNNTRKGMSPIHSLMREIFTDDEAANYTAAMLRNVGVPPVVISPGADASPSQDELEQTKQRYQEITTGDSRGQALVMSGPTTVTTLGFNPQQMDVKNLRRVPEERVSALLGIPAAVVGLGTGLENTKVGATMSEMREQAYESNIIPTQRLMAAELRTQLLPEFGDVRRLKLEFDLSKVRVLQVDQNALWERAGKALDRGGITLNEYRQEIGMEPDPDGDVYYLPGTVTPTDPAELLAPPPQPMLPPPTASVEGAAGQGDPTQTQPPKLYRLPAAKGSKSAHQVGPQIVRLRARLGHRADRQVGRVLKEQQAYVLTRLGAAKDVREIVNPDNVLPRDAEVKLKAALDSIYLSALDGIHAITEEGLGISFDLPDPTTTAFLGQAGAGIRGIHETTLRAVRDSLQEGSMAGESISQLAARIRDLPAFNQQRAVLVSRTELGQATNLAAIHSYRASGVVAGVEILDGDQDEPCASRNGRRLALDNAGSEPPLLHPNCTAAFLPLTDAADIGAAA